MRDNFKLINNFNDYIELEDSYKRLMDIASICKINLDTLARKYDYGAVSYGYYVYEKKRLESICNEARIVKSLRDDIYKYQKTNGEMLKIILNYAKSHQCYRNQEYRIRVIQDTGSSDIYGISDNEKNEFQKIYKNQMPFFVLLVKDTINDTEIIEILNDSEKYNKHLQNGDIVLVDKTNSKLNNQNNFNAYLKKKTINLDCTRGINSNTMEFIKDELFRDYKKGYYEKESYKVSRNVKKKIKKEEQ